MSVDLRVVERALELRACEGVQLRVWGEGAPEVTVASFRAAIHAGALVAGAFEGEALLGFVYGFPSYVGGRVGQHSHLLAVVPEARGRGLGRALKWFQRGWCLARGITRITWTFDPLQAGNAKLNLEHLGATAREYLPDFYGPLGGALNGDLPSDRLLAEWPLDADPVAALAAGERRPEAGKPPSVALTRDGVGDPLLCEVAGAERVWLELPPSVSPATDFERALRWRLALRAAMQPLLDGGFQTTRFVAGGYVLEKLENGVQAEDTPAVAGGFQGLEL